MSIAKSLELHPSFLGYPAFCFFIFHLLTGSEHAASSSRSKYLPNRRSHNNIAGISEDIKGDVMNDAVVYGVLASMDASGHRLFRELIDDADIASMSAASGGGDASQQYNVSCSTGACCSKAFEIFDEDTTRKIVEEHQRDMEEAANAIGSHRMGFITGGDSQGGGKSSGGGIIGRLSGMASMFSAAKTERSQAQEEKGQGLMGKATPVDPEVKVLPFNVREPSLGAAVVGHVTILDGSCYVWASTEGSAAQGSLAAAVSTRFGGGMPTATPLLSGSGGGDAGGGGVSVSMAQRLCKRTGKVVFVSCDLSEDSQILVAAIEAKVVALLKAEG